MSIRHTIPAAALALALAPIGPARAEGLEPAQGRGVALGAVSGIVYYTVEREGLRVVATLAQQNEGAAPLRVEAVLAPGQSVVLSTPSAVGVAPEAVEISRRGDRVLVHGAAAAD